MPARSPELNPIELLCHILVQRLKIVPLDGNHSSERTVKAAKDIMDSLPTATSYHATESASTSNDQLM